MPTVDYELASVTCSQAFDLAENRWSCNQPSVNNLDRVCCDNSRFPTVESCLDRDLHHRTRRDLPTETNNDRQYVDVHESVACVVCWCPEGEHHALLCGGSSRTIQAFHNGHVRRSVSFNRCLFLAWRGGVSSSGSLPTANGKHEHALHLRTDSVLGKSSGFRSRTNYPSDMSLRRCTLYTEAKAVRVRAVVLGVQS